MKNELTTLTDAELTRVSGGFLPLLGLIGAGASIAGKVTGMIGQSKAKKAEQINAQSAAEAQAAGLTPPGGDQQQQTGGAVNPTAGMMPQAAPSSGG